VIRGAPSVAPRAFQHEEIKAMKVVGTNTRRTMSATSLVGDGVRNRKNEDLGKIEDLMIDLDAGRVAYAVLSFGGFLGMGDKFFAVPWNALELNMDDKKFVLDANKQQLENAPGFDKDNWPDFADRTWGASVHQYYKQKPYWDVKEASQGARG
jgi:sporulation protein YlmC with PRC-barrel domain